MEERVNLFAYGRSLQGCLSTIERTRESLPYTNKAQNLLIPDVFSFLSFRYETAEQFSQIFVRDLTYCTI